MSITYRLDADAALQKLDDVARRQVPQAMKETLFGVALSRQRSLSQHVLEELTIRTAQREFANAIRFEKQDRPTKDQLSATLRIYNGPLNSSGAGAKQAAFKRIGALIIRQNTGGARSSDAQFRHGSELVTGGFFIPAPGLRGSSSPIPRKFFPVNLGLTPFRRIENSGTRFASSYKGGKFKRRAGFKANSRFYFVKPGVGIFERRQLSSSRQVERRTPTGGRWFQTAYESEYDAIWFFRQRINLPRRLRLEETFLAGLGAQLEDAFLLEFDRALRTAR